MHTGRTLFGKIYRPRLGVGVVVALLVLLGSCSSDDSGAAGTGKPVRIAYQANLGYAPVIIMKHKGWLDDTLPDHKVSYSVPNSGSLIRTGMLSGDIQFGGVAMSPFFVGWDKGMDWKLLTALSDIDQWMMAVDPDIRSLQDFSAQDKIAVLAADNNQATMLRIAASRALGDPNALDSNVVYMPHQDAVQALVSGSVAAHFTSPPYQFRELDLGAQRITSSVELFGGPASHPAFGALAVVSDYVDQNPEVVAAVLEGVEQAVQLLTEEPEEAAEILAEEFDVPAEEMLKQITHESVGFTTELKGLMEMAEAMKEAELISRVPSSVEELRVSAA